MFRIGNSFGLWSKIFVFCLELLHDEWKLYWGFFGWQALDYVIAEARRHRIRLLLSLVNNLQAYGGKDQYVQWAWQEGLGLSSSNDSFFYDPSIRSYFKNYVKVCYAYPIFLPLEFWHNIDVDSYCIHMPILCFLFCRPGISILAACLQSSSLVVR